MNHPLVIDLNYDNDNQITLKLLTDSNNKLKDTKIQITLPTEKLLKIQEKWVKACKSSGAEQVYRLLGKVGTQSIASSDFLHTIIKYENAFQEWFNSEQLICFKQELGQFFENQQISAEKRVLIQTNQQWICKLPWHRLDIFQSYSCEVGLSFTGNKRVERPLPPLPRAKVRILAIIGDSTGIKINIDKELLEQIPDAKIICLEQPRRRYLYEELWNPHGLDILFFAGHSQSEANGDSGQISINEKESLPLGELKNALRYSIQLGLKLAIFNSCDGLGLARVLADLHIPHIIVFREKVADTVAQEFLKHFLEAYSSNNSLYTSMRLTREKLQTLENIYPCASWLPVICQNPYDAPLTWQNLRGSQIENNWRACCQVMLANSTYKRLLNNPLTYQELGLELEEIYVPLGLVERQKQDRRIDSNSQFYEQEPKYEITQTFQQPEFFEKALKLGQTPKSKGKRLIIIGEAGAGKTTLLQKIADWVLENTSEDVPIWISLADLQKEQSLESYLQNNWLETAMQTVRIPSATFALLVQMFKSGRVWLLLDGIDEFNSINPILELLNQLFGWVAQARIVLTCRLNLWEANKNLLENFDIYRTLDFSYGNAQTPDQVGIFINRWFVANPQSGRRLRSQLDEPGRLRVNNLVKNPLRLSLLCCTWQWQEGNLPQTKAELYQQFTEAIYTWKQGIFPTTKTTEQQLNTALGRIAKRVFDKDTSWFRLPHSLIIEELGEKEAPLFQLALQLGWLNQVGVAAENPSETVYAFFHPTFQEYFAASATQDWHDFLQHDNHHPTPIQGIYRIFQPQWKECIILWLGQSEKEVQNSAKEEFIQALITFTDKCSDFYWYRAFSLAAAGIAEYPNYSHANLIITELVTQAFHQSINQPESKPLRLIAEKAKQALKESDHPRVLNAVIEIEPIPMYFLIEIATNNKEDIGALTNLVQHQTEDTRLIAARKLLQIDPGNQTATNTLLNMLRYSRSPWIYHRAAKSLPGNLEAITILQEILCTPRHPFDGFEIQNILTDISSDNQSHTDSLAAIPPTETKIITFLLNLVYTNLLKNGTVRKLFIYIFRKVCNILVTLHQKINHDENSRLQFIEKLAKLDSENPKLILNLVELLRTGQNPSVYKQATETLKEILSEQTYLIVIFDLKDCLQKETYGERYNCCYEVIWHIAQNLAYPDFHQAWQ